MSLSVRKGEILGIYGLMGAGRSELFECVMGRHPLSVGPDLHRWRGLTAPDTTRRIQQGLALIPEDRQREGLVQCLSIAENLTLASLGQFVKSLFHIDLAKEKQAIKDSIRNLAIKAPNRISKSHRCRAATAEGRDRQGADDRAESALMDEPSRGIDVGAKADVFRTMRRLAGEGLAILFSTSDLEEVMALSDRIAVMSNGRLVTILDRAAATEEAIIAASAEGHKQRRTLH